MAIKNYLKDVKEITAPLNWKSSPNSPTTQLAYVTKPEIDLLVKANLHGSMDGKPNKGPKGIISLDGFGVDDEDSVVSQAQQQQFEQNLQQSNPSLQVGTSQSSFDTGAPIPTVFQQQQQMEQQQNQPVPGVSFGDQMGVTLTPEEAQKLREEKAKKTLAESIQSIYTDPNTGEKGIDTIFRNIYNQIGSPTFTFPTLLSALKVFQKPTAESFRDPNYLATMRDQFKTEKEFDDFVKEYENEIKEGFAGEGRDYKELAEAGELPSDFGAEFKKRMDTAYNQAITGDLGSDLQIRTNPVGYYTDEEGKVTNVPQTSGQALTMAESLTFADIENNPNLSKTEKRRLGAALMEARAIAADNRTTTDATGQVVSGKPILPPTVPPLPGPRPPIAERDPIITPSPTPFPGQGIISAVTDPRFVGPSFPGVLPTGQNYFNQGIADPRFQQFFQIASQFPTTATT